ncbi:MAG: glycosyl hydrolase 53 family protein [Bacteroidales bacterium]|nr:glycosyl hydrolase 53 family protein [Bacteroidales bacterium]
MRRKTLHLLFLSVALISFTAIVEAQQFYFGADLSYINEMEDCGVVYFENSSSKDPYQLFSDHNCNLIRLRLWHTPSWYDALNEGKRYSDLQDVKKSIRRAKELNMDVLLDYHLSDDWADASNQLVPSAWLGVVDNLPLLMDSLYNYISATLLQLNKEGLLPEMIQIGNETNKGILLSPQDNQSGWVLDWNRNSQLFNTAIQAVRDVESQTGKQIQVAVHFADPADVAWFVSQFVANGVTGFDIIGISYYWQYHQPYTSSLTGDVIAALITAYPPYKVMIFETGSIWTTQSHDNANNVLNTVNPSYSPASPENQQKWMIDLTQEVINSGGCGVIYWEPAWVSSDCYTQWGQGSHYENATFFDFNNNLINTGGVGFMQHDYDNLSAETAAMSGAGIRITLDSSRRKAILQFTENTPQGSYRLMIVDQGGREVLSDQISKTGTLASQLTIDIPALSPGMYIAAVWQGNAVVARNKLLIP